MADKMTILITGSNGYLGSHLESCFLNKGYSVYGVDLVIDETENKCPCDITDFEQVQKVLLKFKPMIIIHTAGLSNLSQCEKNPDHALRTNTEGTCNIVESMLTTTPDSKLIFLSSDYVFDGEKGNYKESDKTGPKTVYGKTKLEAESIIRERLQNYVICRTANVFGKGGNFFNFIVKSIEHNEVIDVYDDVFFTPTYIEYLLDSFGKLIEKDFRGLIHIAGNEKVSRYDFAVKIAAAMGKNNGLIKASKQPAGGLIARDSSLNSKYSKKILGNFCPSMEKSLNYSFGNLVYPYFSFIDSRGGIVGITQDVQWNEVNYVESAKGCVRGNHYHKETTEGFLIIKGRVRVIIRNIKSNVQRAFLVSKGDHFIVRPYELHVFEVLEDSIWINMLSLSMKGERKDMYRQPEEG